VQAAIVNLLAHLRDRLDVAYLLISHDISAAANGLTQQIRPRGRT
jgi:ABC-type glutathione transport system ATPase component